MRSNCITCAVIAWARMRRRWVSRGRPHRGEPYLLLRQSRLGPTWLPHVLVGRWSGNRLVVFSFKPGDTRDLPWWLAWRALLFDGRVVRGD
jgi:hypothetical protein